MTSTTSTSISSASGVSTESNQRCDTALLQSQTESDKALNPYHRKRTDKPKSTTSPNPYRHKSKWVIAEQTAENRTRQMPAAIQLEKCPSEAQSYGYVSSSGWAQNAQEALDEKMDRILKWRQNVENQTNQMISNQNQMIQQQYLTPQEQFKRQEGLFWNGNIQNRAMNSGGIPQNMIAFDGRQMGNGYLNMPQGYSNFMNGFGNNGYNLAQNQGFAQEQSWNNYIQMQMRNAMMYPQNNQMQMGFNQNMATNFNGPPMMMMQQQIPQQRRIDFMNNPMTNVNPEFAMGMQARF